MREIEKEEDSAGRVTGCQPRIQSTLGRIECTTSEGLQTDAGTFSASRSGRGNTRDVYGAPAGGRRTISTELGIRSEP